MDPTANLEEQLRLCERISTGEYDPDDVDQLVELMLALHAWIVSGGFLPRAWTPKESRELAAKVRAALKLDRQRVDLSDVSVAHEAFRTQLDRLVRP